MATENSTKKLLRIGEVSRLTGIHPHILRYWESEIQILAPNRQLSKQRFYRQTDIDLILTIKHLLEEEKYTLEGVKQYLTTRPAAGAEPDRRGANPTPGAPPPERDVVRMVREELQAILTVLDADKA